MKSFKSESDLAVEVVRWLRADGWDVYQEVQLARYGRVADIVATRGKILWVIECKLAFSTDVVEQAKFWHHEAHFSSVAVPGSRHRNGLLRWCCGYFGIGVLSVQPGYVSVEERPRLNRKAFADRFREGLRDQQKTFAQAGNCNGHRWTPFQDTCYRLRRIVAASPGIQLKDALAGFPHHYASDQSARCSLRHWIGAGKVDGIRIEEDGRKLRLYSTAAEGSKQAPAGAGRKGE